MTNLQDDQNVQNQPKKADVDELLKQLEALNQEIASKTVADQPQLEEKKDQPEKLEAPLTPPALEESDEPQLPSGNEEDQEKKDLDLDKFIEELEAKIAEKDKGEVSDEETEVASTEPQAELTETELEPVTLQPESLEPKLEPPVQPATEPKVQEEQVNFQENFSRQRPSLDLSGVKEEVPSLTLKNGQLEESKEEIKEDDKSELPKLSLNSEPTLQTDLEPASNTSSQPSPVSSAELSPSATPDSDDNSVNEENLESQNIFNMLGLENLEETEREAFLADLEQLIWDNFIDVELALLLNSEQKAQADLILADNSKTEDERKEALLVYIEEFIPNLEEVMYNKALSLKKEMFEERLKKVRDQATEDNNLSLIADLDQIQELITAGRYKTATELLNKA
jgi:hypothetical protein